MKNYNQRNSLNDVMVKAKIYLYFKMIFLMIIFLMKKKIVQIHYSLINGIFILNMDFEEKLGADVTVYILEKKKKRKNGKDVVLTLSCMK